MSFSEEIKKELLDVQIKKNCCKKAFLLGLLINSFCSDGKTFEVSNIVEDITQITCELLQKIYSVKSEKNIVIKPGKKYHTITFSSRSLSNFFEELNSSPDGIIQDVAEFKCQACDQAFLRGAFLACAKINDPNKGFNLEFSFNPKNITVASKFYRFLSMLGFVPKITNRKNSIGLYIKNNGVISDILYYVGSVKTSFDYSEMGIEKEIRNYENRVTNCVTKNIYRAVSASHKHIEAIEVLIEAHKFDSLPDELKETARLRLNNPETSLLELSLMHSPPITKSGLSHRLNKIILEAENIKNKLRS